VYYDVVKPHPHHFEGHMTQRSFVDESAHKPLARTEGLVIQEVVGETLIYDLTSNKACCLNPSASTVWRYCDGTSSISDIVSKFANDGHGRITEDFVWLAVDQLNTHRLVHDVEMSVPIPSRRLLLKKVGLATVVALPIIATLTAPQSALGHVSCICTSPASCAGMTFCPSTTNCSGTGLCEPGF
jgi:hypothetical protein